MIGIGLGVAQLRRAGASVAPEYVEPVDDDPIAPPAEEPEPPTVTPIDPVTEEPEPGFDPAFTLTNRIEITDSGQSAIRTTNDPGTFGVAYVATPVTGNEYWEYDIHPGTPRGATFAIGITTLDMPLNGIPGERATEIAWWSDGTIRQNGTTLVNLGSSGQLGRGDLAGMAINAAGQVFLFKNCTALNGGDAVGSLASGTRYPFVALYSARTRINMNFSTARFDCALPSGFFPIGQAPVLTIAALTTVGSGTWTVPEGVTELAEVLIVAGGGGGGSRAGGHGGGGGGGIVRLTNFPVTPSQSINYTVGGGGVGGDTSESQRGQNGQNSVFSGNTATGGGGGGGYQTGGSGAINTGDAGGSGGGGGSTNSATDIPGGAGISGQGSDGGNGRGNGVTGLNTGRGGGGGGAGGVGGNAGTAAGTAAGSGGVGLFFGTFANYGQSGYFAGGGGGGGGPDTNSPSGFGGLGGGGDGGGGGGTFFPSEGQNGAANTGGGGGGAAGRSSTAFRSGGNGGSGVILIAYFA